MLINHLNKMNNKKKIHKTKSYYKLGFLQLVLKKLSINIIYEP